MADKLISKKEAAEMLGVCCSTLDKLVAEGKIPMYRIGGACKYFDGEVLGYVRTQRVKASPRKTAIGNRKPYVAGAKIC